jgi:hypothetical protein
MNSIKWLAAVIAGILMSSFTTSEAHAVSFTPIADTNTSFSSFDFFPSINNNGTVVFSAVSKAGGSAIFSSSNSTTSTIYDSSATLSLSPAINDAGTVAFGTNRGGSSGVLTIDSQGNLATIAENTDPRVFDNPVINNKGTVALSSMAAGGREIFISNQGVKTTIADTSGVYSVLDGYALNDAGVVSFSASLKAGGRGIFTVDGGVTNTIANTSDRFSFLFPPALSNTGTVAFKGVLPKLAGEGIYTAHGGKITPIADNSGAFSFFENPAINNQDTVAFKAVLKDGGLGIYTGADPVANKIISTGDTLLGSTVTNLFLSRKGINDANQIVFYAQLANGTSGIFRADSYLTYDSSSSVPEPNSILALLTVGALSAFVRSKR